MAGSAWRDSLRPRPYATASNSTHAASSIERELPQRILGVGQTFSNESDAFRSSRARGVVRSRRHFWAGDADGILAEYVTGHSEERVNRPARASAFLGLCWHILTPPDTTRMAIRLG